MADSWVSVPAIADAFRVDQRTVWKWITAGELPAHRFGGVVRVRLADLETFIASRRVQAKP